ncbi:phosphosulfolactate synthase [Paenibacillus senegalensis]|uniref:phosphosulfolactate synthase n=1 Tax=Paenibacillus senegalensis TaxID=1465766 RepID=UPI0002888201|nr:phosphosulfolactate synthase [Paenibacillus senegalensis]
MEAVTYQGWPAELADPSGRRAAKPRLKGKTMIIDKGIGLYRFEDLLVTAAEHIDMIKLGFGTSALYPPPVLRKKIELARAFDVDIYPGGTFLEVALAKGSLDSFFSMVRNLGFNAVEISDGTIDIDRKTRNELLERASQHELKAYTEYGKKSRGFEISLDDLVETVEEDLSLGAELVTIEGRESGEGVGIFNETGECRDDYIEQVVQRLPFVDMLLWEAPQTSQQVHLLKKLGSDINLGNIAPDEVLSLEALRRGLRSDTLEPGV